jgi:archaellum component FlaG (FlaF/FlaG flagellin family)
VVAPDIEVVKTADPTTIYTNETVTYTYRVTNTGDVPLGSVEVNDSDCTPSYESGNTDGDNLLDTDETWIYTCTTTLSGDKTNTVNASGKPSDESGSPLPGINRVSDQDTAFVNVINPGLSIDKTPSDTKVDPGDSVTYTYTVVNTGDDPLSPIVISDDTCASVTGPSGDDGNNVLDVGETWTYSCTTTLSNDTTNTAIVTGTDSLDKEWPEQDTAFVDVIIAGIQIDKTASAYTIYAGNTVTYTYVVSNTGSDPITDVVVLDDHCDPAVYQSGDTNDDGWLDPGEKWIYECSTSLTGDTTNIATASGEDEQGDPVPEDQSSASVDVINPEIAVAKSADPTVILAGTLVQYTYEVSNPGDDPLRSTWVSDDSCDPVNYVSGDDGNTRLDPGEVWIYECSATINDDTTNIVTDRGLDSLGYWASDTDDEFVDVVTPTIEIIKSADPTFILPGERVQYTYQVSNPGDVPLEYVSVIDNPICAPITLDPAGDVNGNDLLDPGEIWFFQCTQAVVADTINVATAIGLPVYGAGGSQPSVPVSDQDTASVEVGEEQVSPVGGATMPNNPLWSVFLRVGLAALTGLSLAGGMAMVGRKRGRK